MVMSKRNVIWLKVDLNGLQYISSSICGPPKKVWETLPYLEVSITHKRGGKCLKAINTKIVHITLIEF